jgi:hypothetical protein
MRGKKIDENTPNVIYNENEINGDDNNLITIT